MATQFQNEEPEGDSVRDALDAAFEQHATDEVQEAKPAPVAAPVASVPAAAPATTTEEQRARDASGRFAPKTPAEGAAQGAQGAQAATQQAGAVSTAGQPAPPPGGELKAPASWSPTTREQWANLPAEVKAEVHRREVEQNRVLEQGAQARNFISAFENVVRPFELFIRSEGSNPLQAVQNLMQTAAEFRVGTPARKVQLVAGIIRDFGIDLQQLDTMLATGQAPQQQAQQQEFRDPRLDRILAQQAQQAQQQEQQAQQGVHQELQAFATTHEFYNDVANTMADLLGHAARRGETLDLEKAYARACQLDQGISTILSQRAAGAAKGSQNTNAVLRAKRAAASVKGDTTPNAGATVPKDDSVRSAIEAALQAHGNA